MKLNKTMLVILAGVSLFIGFVVFAVGIGAIFPSMHKFTAPLICGGAVQVETTQYSYKPGQVGWEHHIYCDSNGARKEITFPAIGVTGLIASLAIFIVLVIWMRRSVTLPANFGELATDLQRDVKAASSGKPAGSALERLSQLKQMRDGNLITEAEYERKKAEIMKEL